jgi:hypothetical protein
MQPALFIQHFVVFHIDIITSFNVTVNMIFMVHDFA